jgi:hypothetical protein
MSFLRRCSACFTAAFLLSALGCASTSTRESAGESSDDSVNTSKTKAAIFYEPSLERRGAAR